MMHRLLKMLLILLSIIEWGFRQDAQAQDIHTIAGTGMVGYSGDGAAATNASMNGPYGIAADTAGNIYFADADNNCIRKVDKWGVITTIAGTGTPGYSGDKGPATAAMLKWPTYVALDDTGNVLFTDTRNYRIRKINKATGIITTIAGNGQVSNTVTLLEGSVATSVAIGFMSGIAVDSSGNLYISDLTHAKIWKVTPKGRMSAFAGTVSGANLNDGHPATTTKISLPGGLAFSPAGELVYIDRGYNKVRKVTKDGIVVTVAGSDSAGYLGDGGPATTARLGNPASVCFSQSGTMYITDYSNHRIRTVNTEGIITTIAGNRFAGYNGDEISATAAGLFYPTGICMAVDGNIYLTDNSSNRVRMIDTGHVASLSDTLPGESIIVYPNPSGGKFTLLVKSGYTNAAMMQVIDVAGRQVAKMPISTNVPIELQLMLPKGEYIISVSSVNGLWHAKLSISE
jgi:hypothetical protein